MMQRVENWDYKLTQFANSHRTEEFEWGFTDCVTLVRRALMVIHGVDPWEHLVPEYTTMYTARHVLSEVYTFGIDAIMASSGARRVKRKNIHAGDVMVALEADGIFPNVGIVLPNLGQMTSSQENGVLIYKYQTDISGRLYQYWRY